VKKYVLNKYGKFCIKKCSCIIEISRFSRRDILFWLTLYNNNIGLFPLAQTFLNVISRRIWHKVTQLSTDRPEITYHLCGLSQFCRYVRIEDCLRSFAVHFTRVCNYLVMVEERERLVWLSITIFSVSSTIADYLELPLN